MDHPHTAALRGLLRREIVEQLQDALASVLERGKKPSYTKSEIKALFAKAMRQQETKES